MKEYFKDKNIQGKVIEKPFEDFVRDDTYLPFDCCEQCETSPPKKRIKFRPNSPV